MKPTATLRQKIYALTTLIGLLPIMFLFQNCSQTRFISDSANSIFKNQNNGSGYGGKPTGTYYRFSPGFTCETKETFSKSLAVAEGNVILTENKINQCNAITQNLTPDLIDSSIYQNQVVGYQDGIFEGLSSEPDRIPANLVEVWCRDTKDQTGIETITYFDRITQLAVNRIYYATANNGGGFTNRMIDDFNVARTVSATTVTLRDSNGFELIVYRNQPDSEVGLFRGHLTANLNGTAVNRDTKCRFGGSLDSSRWPVQTVVDANILYIKQSPDKKMISYSTSTGFAAGKAGLFSSLANGQNSVLVNDDISLSNNLFHFTPDSKQLTYMSDGGKTLENDILVSSVDKVSSLLISKDSTNGATYRVTADGKYVVYNAGMVRNSWLRAVPLDGQQAVDLHPPVLTTAMQTYPSGTGQYNFTDTFAVSPEGNDIAYLCCGTDVNVYVAKADGTSLNKIVLPVPAGSSLFGLKYPSETTGKVIVASAWTDPLKGPITYTSYAFTSDGQHISQLPSGWMWYQTSPTGTVGLITILPYATQMAMHNILTKETTALPILSGGQFSKDSSYFYGKAANISGSGFKILTFSTANGAKAELCPGVSAQSVDEITPNVFAITGGETGSGILKVYLTSPGEPCRLVNSVAVDKNPTNNVLVKIFEGDTNLLILRRGENGKYIYSDALLYVPLNGKPAIKINSAVHQNATIDFFEFTDSSTIIYSGDQIRSGEKNLFWWKPKN